MVDKPQPSYNLLNVMNFNFATLVAQICPNNARPCVKSRMSLRMREIT